MKKFFNFIFSKAFWFNILGIILLFVIAVVVLMLSLKSCTRHGDSVTVPTVVGLDADEAIKLLDDEDFGAFVQGGESDAFAIPSLFTITDTFYFYQIGGLRQEIGVIVEDDG